ncbi:MAG: flagellar hook-length control protein FliK [Candidatus Zixiibacteriota bacterium]|nr:MAG: flagellar hook-length control protein FliK [candidate division Zixibacteria bacterium]
MGYLFQNIGQLAGFLAHQEENRHSEKPAGPISEISFRSIFDSSIGSCKINVGELTENDCFNENIELVERTFINEDTLRALIEKQGNIITLEISSDEISRYLDDLSLPTTNKKYGSAIIPANSMTNAGIFGFKKSGSSTCRITFNTSDLFNKTFLPVDFGDTDGQSTTRLVEVTGLARLISEYPDPIQAEIAIIPARGDHNDINELKSSFKFDLRNLFSTNTGKSPESIEGLISLSAGQLSKNTFFESRDITHNNNESPQKAGVFKPENEFYKAEILKELFPLDRKASITLPRLKNHVPQGVKSNSQNENHIVPDSSNKIESAGADEFKSLRDNNPSALSKFPVGSNGASEVVSAKSGNNSPDEFADQYGILKGVISKDSPLDIKELPFRSLENVPNIKARIIDAIENGRLTVRMRLHPENLGSLHIKLQWKGGTLLTEFRVENARAAETVSTILPDLKASLEEARLKLADMNVVVDDRGKDFSSAHNPQYYSGSAGDGTERRNGSPFEDHGNPDIENVSEKTDRIDNPETASIHKGWIDLKA